MSVRKTIVSAALLIAASLAPNAKSATVAISFMGSGVSGNIQVTYGPVMDSKVPQGFEITGVTGFFSDSNNGLNIVNAPVGPLIPITRDTPEPDNLLAPHDFSRYAVAAGLSPQSNGFVTYDNLYYPGGSPQTASDYPLHGGMLDIYGLMFSIGGGRVVDLWSNGTITGSGSGPIYGVAVVTHDVALDYVGGITATLTPEPATMTLLGGGLAAFLIARKRRSTRMQPLA